MLVIDDDVLRKEWQADASSVSQIEGGKGEKKRPALVQRPAGALRVVDVFPPRWKLDLDFQEMSDQC